MNKQELIQAVLDDKSGKMESKAAASRAVDAVLDSIATGLKKDGMVQLIGFGTWEVKTRAARKGVNPSTGEPLKIKAAKVVRFKPGANLKETAKKSKAKK